MRLLKNTLHNPIWNQLIPEREFWDERVTEDEIRIGKYYVKDGIGKAEIILHTVIYVYTDYNSFFR
jgi:hypothetical protein